MKQMLSILLAGGLVAWLLGHQIAAGRSAPTSVAQDEGLTLGVTGERGGRRLLAAPRPEGSETTQMRLSASGGKPKIAHSFNADDDLAAIRRAGFTHVLVSYLQGRPDAEQRWKLDQCRRHGLKVIYRMVDLVDRDRRTGGDARMRHAVELLRDHPALAGWQTYEETNLPPAAQVAVYRKIKGWDPHHPILIVTTNEYSEGWYRRTYSDDAQDILMIDFYPYKRRYDGWVYIHRTVPAILAVQKRPVPIIPIIQASSATNVRSSDDTLWPPPGGLVKQLNLWWSLGADAGVAFWLWRGSPEYPFVGLADRNAPPYALKETEALLKRIPDGALPFQSLVVSRKSLDPGDVTRRSSLTTNDSRLTTAWLKALRLRPPTVNHLKNSGFEDGLAGWVGYNKIAGLTEQALQGRQAARMENSGSPHTIGVGQRTDLVVPPNATVTLSCSYKVLRETTLLQWKINTTAYPKFGAAEFLERRERLPAGDWRRGSVSATNSTGAPQRVTGVAVSSNGFTGEVLLDNFQLELSPVLTSYSDPSSEARTAVAARRRAGPVAGLRYDLPTGSSRAQRTQRPDRGTGSGGWTLSAWSMVETPPGPGSHACLASVSPASGGPIELRFTVDAGASDANGWVGILAVTQNAVDGGPLRVNGKHRPVAAGPSTRNPQPSTLLELPIALAPRQPLFWALSSTTDGALTLHAAPAAYRLERATAPRRAEGTAKRQGRSTASSAAHSARRGLIRSILLGADPDGEHRLQGLVGGGRFVPRVLTDAEVERLRNRPPVTR